MTQARAIYKDPHFIAAARAEQKNRKIEEQVMGIYQPLTLLPSPKGLGVIFLLILASQISPSLATTNRRARREEANALALTSNPNICSTISNTYFAMSPVRHYSHKPKRSSKRRFQAPECTANEIEIEEAFFNDWVSYFVSAHRAGHLKLNSPVTIQNVHLPLLTHAVRHHKHKIFEFLLSEKADPNSQSKEGLSALHVAAKLNQDAILPLIQAGANPNIEGKDGTTPLMIAIAYNPDAIQPLMTAGAVDKPICKGLMAYTIQLNQNQEFWNILRHEENIDENDLLRTWKEVAKKHGEKGIIPKKEFVNTVREAKKVKEVVEQFTQAVLQNNLAFIKENFSHYPIELFSQITFNNLDDNSVDSLLFYSIRHCKIDLIDYLLANKINVLAKQRGSTTLHYAARYCPDHMLNFDRSQVDCHAKDSNGLTAFHIAIQSGSTNTVSAALTLYQGANPLADDDVSALLFAATHQPDLIPLMISNQIKNIDFPSASTQTTPLIAAAKHGHFTATNALIHAGANVKAMDIDGMTALHYAVVKNNGLVPLLLKAGAKINAKSNAGETPLIIAVQKGNVATLKQLVDAGATYDMEEVKQAFAKREAIEKIDFREIEWILLKMSWAKWAFNSLLETITHPITLLIVFLMIVYMSGRRAAQGVSDFFENREHRLNLLLLNNITTNLLKGKWRLDGNKYAITVHFENTYKDENTQNDLFNELKSFLKTHCSANLSSHRGEWHVSRLSIRSHSRKSLTTLWMKKVIELIRKKESEELKKQSEEKVSACKSAAEKLKRQLTAIAEQSALECTKIADEVNQIKNYLQQKNYAELFDKIENLLKNLQEKNKELQQYKNERVNQPISLMLSSASIKDATQPIPVEEFETTLQSDSTKAKEIHTNCKEIIEEITHLLRVANENIQVSKIERRRKQLISALNDPTPFEIEEINNEPATQAESVAPAEPTPTPRSSTSTILSSRSAEEKKPDATYLLTEQRPLPTLPSPLITLSVLTNSPQHQQASVRLHLANMRSALEHMVQILNQNHLPTTFSAHSLLYHQIRFFQSMWQISDETTESPAWKAHIAHLRHVVVHAACINAESKSQSEKIFSTANALQTCLLKPITDLCDGYNVNGKPNTLERFVKLFNENTINKFPLLSNGNPGNILPYTVYRDEIENALNLLRETMVDMTLVATSPHLRAYIKMLIVRIGEAWHLLEKHYPEIAKLMYGHAEVIIWINKKDPRTLLDRARILRNHICHDDKIVSNKSGKWNEIDDVSTAKLLAFMRHIPSYRLSKEILNPNAPHFTPGSSPAN